MKLASYKNRKTGKASVGVRVDGGFVDLHAASNGALPNRMLDFLELGDDGMRKAREIAAGARPGQAPYVPDADAELQAPVPKPGKIMHTSCNFPSHLSELTTWQAPEWQSHNWGTFHFEHPTGFLEAPSSVVPTEAEVKIPHFTKQLDYEIEVGIVIGKEAFRVPVDKALQYVAGLTIFNDLSARDIQAREHANKVILLGKSFNGSCPFGPWLVTLDEIGNPDALKMVLTLNDEERQNSSTANMQYKIAELVSWWSNTTLQPGDIITTGSPPGVIAGRPNTAYLKAGDVIRATVEKIGTLTTHIVAGD
jgi:2-keto-4-pentenoate hydratase/2-oxohepta-3-ene-1,7-dioic acid hydratase in catechol pathway